MQDPAEGVNDWPEPTSTLTEKTLLKGIPRSPVVKQRNSLSATCGGIAPCSAQRHPPGPPIRALYHTFASFNLRSTSMLALACGDYHVCTTLRKNTPGLLQTSVPFSSLFPVLISQSMSFIYFPDGRTATDFVSGIIWAGQGKLGFKFFA